MNKQATSSYVVVNQATGERKTTATQGVAMAFAQYMAILGQRWEVVGS